LLKIFVQKALENFGKSAIANARGQLCQVRTGKKGEQIVPILKCEGTKKYAYFVTALYGQLPDWP
jgi:hypothetical protein